MTGWWGIYVVQEEAGHAVARHDVGVHPEPMTCGTSAYTYNCLPTHSWYCGLALLLAPTVANHLLEQGRLDPEPRLHAGPVVHVLPGSSHVRERLHLRGAVGEQPRREPGRFDSRPCSQRRRRRLRDLPRQEARCEPLHCTKCSRARATTSRPCCVRRTPRNERGASRHAQEFRDEQVSRNAQNTPRMWHRVTIKSRKPLVAQHRDQGFSCLCVHYAEESGGTARLACHIRGPF